MCVCVCVCARVGACVRVCVSLGPRESMMRSDRESLGFPFSSAFLASLRPAALSSIFWQMQEKGCVVFGKGGARACGLVAWVHARVCVRMRVRACARDYIVCVCPCVRVYARARLTCVCAPHAVLARQMFACLYP